MRVAIRYLAAAALLAAFSPAALADVHKDEQLGFQVNVPQGWKKVPVKADEEYVVAKFLCDRYYAAKDGTQHTPEMKVILFRKGTKTKTEGAVTEDGGITLKQTFKDFKDWLKDNSYGGYFLSKEEETKVADIPATWIEVKFEKLTTPRHGLAVVFHRSGADFVVQFEVLEDQWDKLGPQLASHVKSFKFFPGKVDLNAPPTETKKPDATGPDGEAPKIDNSPEARKRRRDAAFQKELDHGRATLPKDWKELKSKNYYAFTHVDDKYTKRILDQAETMRAWSEKTFASLATQEAGPLIIRICSSVEEERSYSSSSAMTWGRPGVTITTHKDLNSGGQGYEFQWINQMTMRYWMRDACPSAAQAMPGWLREGLDQFVMTAVMKGGRLDFKPDDYERDLLRLSSKQGKIIGAKALLSTTWEEFVKVDNPLAQAGAFVRYLMDGPGATAPRTRGRVLEYMKNLSALVSEREKSEAGKEGAAEGEAKTEEEEEQRAAARNQRWRAEEKALVEEMLKRTFGDYDAAAWNALEVSWRKFVE